MKSTIVILTLLLSCLLLCNSWMVNPYHKHRINNRSLVVLKKSMRLMDNVNDASSNQLTLKAKLSSDMKEAMKQKEKNRLAAIRAIQTAIKQKEVDDQIEVTDELAIGIMSKLVKQRKESIKSYNDAGRQDLVDNEQFELDVINSYLPKQLSEEEIIKLIDDEIAKVGATSVKDMGKVMNVLRPVLLGKADISSVGEIIKKKLSGK